MVHGSVRVMVLAAAFGLLFLAACGSDSSTGGVPCTSDQACPLGLACEGGTCQKIPCQTAGDCAGLDQRCLEVAGEKVCTAPECGCATCGACPTGETCSLQGLCVPDTGPTCTDTFCPGDPCTDDAQCAADEQCKEGACWPDAACFGPEDCGEGEVCDAKACRPCVGEECGTTGPDCTVDGCPANEACNPVTKACEPKTVDQGDPCSACSGDGDCPGGWKCVPLASGNACLPPCTSNNDCESGWSCQGGSCAPAGYSCTGCVVAGCADGQVCNTVSGDCAAPRALCEPCTYGWECGPDAACIKESPGLRLCKPRCGGDFPACLASSSCQGDADSGLQVCLSSGSTCCYDADPTQCQDVTACNPPCGGPTPFCVDGSCVQCTNDTHCPPESSCNVATGTCSGTTEECVAPTPFFWEGQCVQCLNNTHCPVTGYCNTATKTCSEQGGVCDQCDSVYPACAEIGGEYYCVQCVTDADCPGDCGCDENTFSCEGNCVVTEQCDTDADCDPGITSFNLKCDPGSKVCYDTKGGCDDVTAFCKKGNKCLSIFDAFLGGGGGGGLPQIPGLPGGGGGGGALPIPGFCECNGLEELVNIGDPSKRICEDAICADFGILFNALSGGSGGANPGIGGAFCFALAQ